MPRVNRAIELLAAGQPVYYDRPVGRGYEGGRESAGTWADYLSYEMEHSPYEIGELRDFMRGLAEAGPTRSGHRTPAVIVTLPLDGADEVVIRSNSWIIKQVLACGVHGLLLCHADTPGAIKAFVEYARYPFNTLGVGAGLDEGRRNSGGQAHAAQIWGVSTRDYLALAEPWPLNPDGELLLGVKIENRRALSNVESSLRVPGIAFAEWGPGDMAMSLGYPWNFDPPYPAPMVEARSRIFAACTANKLAILDMVTPEDVVARLSEGVTIGATSSPVLTARNGREAAEIGRRHTERVLPW
jgi:4-hydroxy-2-oxoheptanedioate aldolase